MELGFIVLFTILAFDYTSAFEDVNLTSSELSGCQEIPTVENAEVSTTSLKSNYVKGDSLIYTCHQGFIGRITFSCDGNKWNNHRNSQCSRKRCSLPEDIPNGRFTLINGTEFVFGSIIKYTCKTGYQMVSLMDTRTCLVEGWSNHLPECNEISCSEPVQKDNLIIDGLPEFDNPLRYGHELTFSCNLIGFKLVGAKNITCGENGKWSDSFPSCEEITCELEETQGVSVVGLPQNNAPIKYGHKLRFYCSQMGMILRGNEEITCSDEGRWSKPFPICEELACKEGELSTVRIFHGFPGTSPPYKPKHTLQFQCIFSDWVMTGESKIKCREDGTWDNPFPICSEKRGCGPPPLIEFADLTTLQKPFYGSYETIEYKCQSFYTMSGDPIKTCVQGEWRGRTLMRCLKPCIADIPTMDAHGITQLYGPKRTMYATHNDHITFKCQKHKHASYGVNFRPQCNDGVMHFPTCY